MSGEEQDEIVMMSSSIYEPLEPGFIRVLHIQPAKQLEAPLIATLELLQLTDDADYEALSYAWDGAFNDQELEDGHLCLNGTIVAIKGNLRDALRRLRRGTEIRVLWVDALCINQEDLAERSAQVAIMSQIYSSASQVVMWVGEDTPEGDGKAYLGWCRKSAAISKYPFWRRLWRDAASSLVKQHILYVNCDWIKHQMFNRPVFYWRPGKHSPLMWKFGTRRYLTRRWCIQETAFAKRVLVLCGPHELWLTERNDGNKLCDVRPALRLGSERHREDVLEFLAECSRGLQCKDERDYIYAPASVLRSRRGCPLIIIDYTLPWTQVHASFAHSLMLANGLSGTWRVLYMAGEQHTISQGRSADLPSWVPDWSRHLYDDDDWKKNARSTIDPAFSTEADSLVTYDGKILGIRLACYGDADAASASMHDWYLPEICQAGDRLYGPLPERMRGNMGLVDDVVRYKGHLLVLRPCDGERGAQNCSFRIVGIEPGWKLEKGVPFEGMHDLRIR